MQVADKTQGLVLLPPRKNHRVAPAPTVQIRGNDYKALSNSFIHDLYEDWQVGGKEAIVQTREKFPQIYVQVVARLAQVHRIEVGMPNEFSGAQTREELLDRIGEKFGTKGRQMFAAFVAKLDKLAEEGRAGLE